jgi:hypothetical protein
MNVSQIISEFEQSGGALWLEGEKVKFKLPDGKPELVNLLAQLRPHKDTVRLLLTSRQPSPCGSPGCGGCYSIGEGKSIHPPKPTREWLQRWTPPEGTKTN